MINPAAAAAAIIIRLGVRNGLMASLWRRLPVGFIKNLIDLS